MSARGLISLCRSSQRANVFLVNKRFASSESHHHHEEHGDSTSYPKEGFGGPFWRNVTIIALATAGIAQYAPAEFFPNPSTSEDDAPWLTRVLAYYTPPRELWMKRSEKHLIQADEAAERTLFFQNAQQPIIRRYRYPSTFEQGSTHGLPVGGLADLSDLIVKRDGE